VSVELLEQIFESRDVLGSSSMHDVEGFGRDGSAVEHGGSATDHDELHSGF